MNGRTQTDRILAHMRRGRSITPLQALNRYGCFRLASRIFDLRRAGVSVRCQIVKRGAKHVASYSWP